MRGVKGLAIVAPNKNKARREKKKAKARGAGWDRVIDPRNPAPQRMRRILRWYKNVEMNNIGAVYANDYYTPTMAYDIDPALGSTSMPGFSEFAGLYTHYRVNKWKASVAFANRETALELNAYLAITNGTPSTNEAANFKYLANRRSVMQLLTPRGGIDVCDLEIEASQKDFGGYAETMDVADFTVGSTTSSATPTNNIFLVVGIDTPGVLANGVNYVLTLDVEIDFFELATPNAMPSALIIKQNSNKNLVKGSEQRSKNIN